jgi:hypothetical protein
MQDVQARLEKLRSEAAECRLISDLATDKKKRELFARLADHLSLLAAEIANAIVAQNGMDPIAGNELPSAEKSVPEPSA